MSVSGSSSASPLATALQQQRILLDDIAAGTPLHEALTQFAGRASGFLSGQRKGDGGAGPDILQLAILLKERGRPELQLLAGHRIADWRQALSGVQAKGDHPFALAMQAGKPVHVPDFNPSGGWHPPVQPGESASCWCFPIPGGAGSVHGVLVLLDRGGTPPTRSEEEWLLLAANAAGLAIDAARWTRVSESLTQHYRQVIDSASEVAIISTDLAGMVTSWSKGAEQVLGWSESEMRGESLQCIYTPEDRAAQRYEAEMAGALRYGWASDERWHLDKSGGRFWAVGQLTLLRKADGELDGFVKVMRNRTAHKQADERLQHLTQELELEVSRRTRERDRLWRNSLDLLLVIDAAGVMRAVNPAWRVHLGYAEEELVGRRFHPFVHPDDVDAINAAIRDAMQAPLEHLEVRLLHKDGSLRWIEWRAAAEEDLIYANGRNITLEKKQAAQLAEAQETRLKLALEAGQMGGWEWQAVPDRLEWMHGAAQVHGLDDAWTSEPMRFSKYLVRHVHAEDRQRVAAAAVEALGRVGPQRLEYRVLWPDGSVHWIEARGLVFGEGDTARGVGVVADITRRKRSEQDLQFLARASAELSQLIDPQSTLDKLSFLAVPHFADWCVVTLVQEDGKLRRAAVAHVDPTRLQRARRLSEKHGSAPADSEALQRVLATGRAELTPVLTGEMLESRIADPVRRRELQSMGLRSLIIAPLTAHGVTVGAVSFASTDSGRVYGEQDLALAEDLARRVAVALENARLLRSMRQSERAKDVFLATLAHELRNPLAALVGGIALMELSMDRPERLRDTLQLMSRQSGHLSRLVDDLMDVSRISTGKVQLKKEMISLQHIVSSALEASDAAIRAGGHQLDLDLPNDPWMIEADPLRLSQVLANLLTNAAKYTPSGGRISLVLEATSQEYVVRVADNGIGIEPAMQKGIFQMFTQARHPIENRQGGLGIGLSLVDGLTRLHGGRVAVHSEGAGRGSEFVVFLPRPVAAIMPPVPGDAPRQPTAATRPSRIQVVDDNRDAASTVSEVLRVLGHQVFTSYDGRSALDQAAREKPDVILLDIGLPGLDGYEVARRLRADPVYGQPVLVALTGWGQETDLRNGVQAGFDYHWVKPVSLEQLRQLASLTPVRKS